MPTNPATPIRFDVITLFAPMFDALTAHGVTGRAVQRGLWQLVLWNPRDFTDDTYRRVDDRPYGGGPGMVMLPEPLARTIEAIRAAQVREAGRTGPVICLSPQGAPLTDARVRRLLAEPVITLLAGRYEAIDQRLIDRHVDEEIAVGDFVVSGGELPAMMLIDAVVRRLPGALNDESSAANDSFAAGLLDCPHYTRPEVFEGAAVPPVLLSGHHANIARWRRDQALLATASRRPALIEQARRDGCLSPADERVLGDGSKKADEIG